MRPRIITPTPLGIALNEKSDSADQRDWPLVSVIVPTCNRSRFIGTAVKSVFAQDYRPIECVIIDDGSTDDTAVVLERLSQECPDGIELRYFRKENGGANSARNLGLMRSHGKFICYLDSDDRLTPDSIAVRVAALIANPAADFSYGLTTVVDENGRAIGRMNSPWPDGNEARISAYLFDTNSPMIRKTACTRAGFWREDDSFAQEFEYFSRLKYVSNKVAFIDRPLSLYLKHSNESIFDRSNAFYLAEFRVLLLVKALIVQSECDSLAERRELAETFRRLAKQLYRLRDYRHAACALFESLSLGFRLKLLGEWIAIMFLACLKMDR